MNTHRRAGLLFLSLGVALVSTGAAWPLNPLVTRNPQPSGPVPAECAEGLVPAPAPRVIVTEIPPPEVAPASVAAPPSRTLRNTLEDAHAALVRNDRPAFDAALATARAIVRDYPPGGERTAADEAVRVYEDAALVWDAQFESPFFSESSETYRRVSRYPGYAAAVRRGVLTDDRERRFYPAAESRDFLTRVAAESLGRLGIRATTRVTRAERQRSAAPPSIASAAPDTPALTRRRTTARRSTSPRRASAASTTRTRKSATPAISAPASPDPPASARAVTESAPAAPPAAAPTPAAPASPAAEGQPAADVPDSAPTPAAPDAATLPPAIPDTAPGASVPAAAPADRRSVLVPALLIFIGLGVLFVLFRVSK